MPIAGLTQPTVVDTPYFDNLEQLDAWASAPARKLEGILEYTPRPLQGKPGNNGKLLVCHDYKGGYTENSFALSYTFNYWPICDSFVYFSHRRVTIPPPGWITAAHRQGVKMLGVLIFEGGSEEDCLRLLVGRLPQSKTGPAVQSATPTTLPLSPHYARLLADLAYQRGFDGYLLNFETFLSGGVEQTRALSAWITLLQSEILAKVGPHGETVWYDSVIYSGQLAWQDRLNSYNLPFFLSSSSFFSNYTWPISYPNLTAQYFLSLDPSLTGNAPDSQPAVAKKSLNDVYIGIDVWGRGQHGGGGLGCYKALDHIAPESLGLSVALFAPAWTWETQEADPGWTWDQWWAYDSTLWVGPPSGDVTVPDSPSRAKDGDPRGDEHGPFKPINAYFLPSTPPNPIVVPFHTTFSPGVGRTWFVQGIKMFDSPGQGWTDLDKQGSVGDLIWPRPKIEWEGEKRAAELPTALPIMNLNDAWNGGSSLRLSLADGGSTAEDAVYRSVWLPVQSLAVSPRKSYEATAMYKIESAEGVDLDIGLSVKLTTPGNNTVQVTPNAITNTELTGGWTKLSIHFIVVEVEGGPVVSLTDVLSAIGLVIAIAPEDPKAPLNVSILLGQLNVYPSTPASSSSDKPQVLWVDFTKSPPTSSLSGVLTWETATSFPALGNISINSPEDPISAWKIQPSNPWFPTYVYFNIFALQHPSDGGAVGPPSEAVWVGTTGLDGIRNRFEVIQDNLPPVGDAPKVRFYVQGVTDEGEVLPWEQCAYVDVAVEAGAKSAARSASGRPKGPWPAWGRKSTSTPARG